MNLRKAAEMALKVLTDYVEDPRCQKEIDEAVDALRQALAQPVDAVNISAERVDETEKCNHVWTYAGSKRQQAWQCLNCQFWRFSEPVAKRDNLSWVGLTEDEKYDVLEGATGDGGRVYYDTLFRSYEAKLKEKNSG